MNLLERGDVAATIDSPAHVDAFRHLVDGEPGGVERAGQWVFSRSWLESLQLELRARIEAADALDPGVPGPSEPWAEDVLPLLPFERRGSMLYLPGAVPELGERTAEAEELERHLVDAGVAAVKVEDRELARFLEAQGRLVRLGGGQAIGVPGFEAARDVLVAECRAKGSITLARFRDMVGTGRRDAQLLLERFDADGLSRRVGDERVLRRGADR
jgi:hypothetical protein